jgi:FkbM family methyltransferase
MDVSAVNPEIDDQGAELGLIAALVPSLADRSMIDVGSEHGAVAANLRAAGLGPAWLVEPYPGSVEFLRRRFAPDDDVHVLDVAAGIEDGSAELHLARDPSGETRDAFHTLNPTGPGRELIWEGSVEVAVRSLDSLVASEEIPGRVGLLKIDSEGSDADVLRGATSIRAEVVMVEFWGEFSGAVGACPFNLEEIRSLVERLGPRRFLFVRHGPRHVGIGRWDAADPGENEWGNLIFVADSLVDAAEAALPKLDRALRRRSERITAEQERAAAERLELAEELARTAQAAQRPMAVRLWDKHVRSRRGPSAASPAGDAVDDVEQEGGGGRPVERPVIEADGDKADGASNDLPVADDGALGNPVDSEDAHLRGVEKGSRE